MTQVDTLNNLRAIHYKEKIPALEALIQLGESVHAASVPSMVASIIKAYNIDDLTFGHFIHLAQLFQRSTNIIEAACQAHKRVFGCAKHSSLITSLDTGRIKGRELQMFLHQLANILTQAINTPADVQGALTRHLMQVDSEWFPE
ncbi:hypothetical protein [Pseudomonas kurunegalensis]|uniref:hypothetical protein n=1 Tax=Pseudomonas kurunegalensis TaxID=485880 RepID=UPI004024F34A